MFKFFCSNLKLYCLFPNKVLKGLSLFFPLPLYKQLNDDGYLFIGASISQSLSWAKNYEQEKKSFN